MIRINLLPAGKKQARAASGNSQTWAVAYLLAAFVWCVALMIFYQITYSGLEEQQKANLELDRQVQAANAKTADIKSVEEKLQRSKQLETVVRDLQSARQGPTRLLMELSRILSENGGPAIDPKRLEELRRDNPLVGFNPGWDYRRLWLTSFAESSRECQIAGFGKSNEDVAELLRRLTLSDLFSEVTLESTKSELDPTGGAPLIRFQLTSKVRY